MVILTVAEVLDLMFSVLVSLILAVILQVVSGVMKNGGCALRASG